MYLIVHISMICDWTYINDMRLDNIIMVVVVMMTMMII